ncbi:carboxypeptidase-like regulatory domain-containing protein [Longimicrobium sp.]|uniref:carboxypeptidase-like regulatory domain-containing protein n=1 Tax=Longimicrobium sp. TaxID=2029185 RepID=UPI002B542434|nr:carboxypeptidase-like regulatory domain-containing protein [Longimicrobium sp.]HSU17311.1 carboxypeptidase-like regulatory domain-containing protein [Longimicrobium sp.]
MRPRLAALLISISLPIAAPMAAQAVDGRLMGADGASGIPAALVRLVLGDSVVDEAATRADGGFTLASPGAGTFSIVARVAGGSDVEFGPVTLAAGERVPVLLRLPAGSGADRPVALAGVTATAEVRRQVLERHGFYERQHLHPGRFLTHDELARLPGISVLDHIRGLGILVDPRGANISALYRYSKGAKCFLAVWLDGQPARYTEITRLTMDEVAGVEYYRGEELPLQFNPYYTRRSWDCGAVVIWTRQPDAS